MRRRILAVFATFVAAILGSLVVASPAHADTGGPTLNNWDSLCLTPQGNAPWQGTLIVQAQCDIFTTGARNLMQEWTAVCTNSTCSSFHYVNRGSGRCLRARGPNGPALGLQIMLWDCNSISDLNWVYRPTGGGRFSLESRLSNSHGYCLDVPGAAATPDLALQLWYCNGTVAQIFWAPFPVLE
jgi:hypothetical protein